jgi:hypothetical protein
VRLAARSGIQATNRPRETSSNFDFEELAMKELETDPKVQVKKDLVKVFVNSILLVCLKLCQNASATQLPRCSICVKCSASSLDGSCMYEVRKKVASSAPAVRGERASDFRLPADFV